MPGPIPESYEELISKDENELYKPLDKKELEVVEELLNHEIFGKELDLFRYKILAISQISIGKELLII